MDAREHLYKVLVIGEYGVGESFYDPLVFYWFLLITCFLFLLPGKVSTRTAHWVTSVWGLPNSLSVTSGLQCWLFILWVPTLLFFFVFLLLLFYRRRRRLFGDTLKVSWEEDEFNWTVWTVKRTDHKAVFTQNSWLKKNSMILDRACMYRGY